jgi:hypothetical protein
MTYKLKFDPGVNCVFIQHFGDIDVDEMSEQVKSLAINSEYIRIMNIFRDVTLTS